MHGAPSGFFFMYQFVNRIVNCLANEVRVQQIGYQLKSNIYFLAL